jgi:NADH:ubiquinone oxidoreductase subunit F (NADH-binding)/NADH:ubiquinone oxidoreductase subunit E
MSGAGIIVDALTRVQEEHGWLDEARLCEVARELGVPLHRVESLSTFYTHFRRAKPGGRAIDVCRDLPCMLAGGQASLEALRRRCAGRDDLEIREASCLGRCDRAPAAVAGDVSFSTDAQEQIDAILAGDPSPGETPQRSWDAADPYATEGERYGAVRAAREQDRSSLVALLEASGLRGMGGAGFPTGRKWSLVAAEPATPRYVICNADESEPGTFKDRDILRDLPHLVIEGMALAAHAIDAQRGWVFIRHEYAPERRALEAEIRVARERGVLGADFDVDIFVSPGGYILGEETALLECMEDRRGEPRNKPPFPGVEGLWERPTLINNVETFAHAAGIARNGIDWWEACGREGFRGHKFLSVSGDVARPQVLLVPMGAPLREVLERCGGMKDGRLLAAVAPGGASSPFLGPEALDVPVDFESLQRAGSMLGSGAVVFVGEGHDLLDVGLNVTRFFRNESCGKCVPCRIGTQKAVALVEERGGVDGEVHELLRELEQTLVQTSLCGLGQVALAPLLSIVERFRDGIREGG